MNIRSLSVAVLCLLLGAGYWFAVRPAGSNTPEESVHRRPYDAQATMQTVSFWQKELAGDSTGGAKEANRLASAYLALQREKGQVSYARKAEEAARRSLAIRSAGNYEALSLLGSSLLSQHRFEKALDVAQQAVAISEAGNRLLAQVHLDLGNYDRAASALGALTPDSLSLPKRDLNARMLTAQLLSARGHDEEALDLKKSARDVADDISTMPRENVGWYRTMVCHHLVDHGRLEEGAQACRAALEVFPQDYRAMTGLAEVAAYREHWGAVIDWSEKVLDVSSEQPEALRLLIDAYRSKGEPQRAAAYGDSLRALYEKDARLYARHWAMYLADEGKQLDEALRIVRNDLTRRRDAGAYGALAWVLYQQEKYAEAEAAIQKALAEGTRSVDFFHHAGLIARAQGEPQKAQKWFEKAKSVNAYYTAPE